MAAPAGLTRPSDVNAGVPGLARHRAGRRPPDRWLLAIPAALAVASTISWWANRPGGAGAALISIGQLTGLGSSVFALVTIALMARVPVVINGLGADRTVVWHRRAATVTVVLLVLHVPTTILGYAAADATNPLAETSTLLTSYPDMLTATVGALLLWSIALSSIRALRRRLRYETWLFGHWYAYVAVALAFGHELANGASFSQSTAATLVWTWLHLFVAGLVLWYRVLLPVGRMAAQPIRVADVRPAGGGAVHLHLFGRGLDRYQPRAGRHLRVRFLTPGGWWQSHPFSLSARPKATTWRITVAPSGDYTRGLADVRPRTRALVSTVSGALTADNVTTGRVALIAGGSGVTPLRALLDDLPADLDIRFLYRATDEHQLIARAELERLMAARGRHVDFLLGARHPDPARDVLAPATLTSIVPDLAHRDVYVCGHAGFVDAVCRSLHAIGTPAGRIHTERFDP